MCKNDMNTMQMLILQKIENGIIKVRTYERGVEGETLACGTGMAACFLRANELGSC